MATPEIPTPIDRGYLGKAEFRRFGEEVGSVVQAGRLYTQLCFPMRFPVASKPRGYSADIIKPWKLGLDVLLRADIQLEPVTDYAGIVLPSDAVLAHHDFHLVEARHAVMNTVIAADTVVHFARHRQDRAAYFSPKALALLEEELPLWIAQTVSVRPNRSGRGWKKFLAQSHH